MGHTGIIRILPARLPVREVDRNADCATGNFINLKNQSRHDDILQYRREPVAVDPVDGHTLLLAEPALHLCRLRVPGVGIVNKGDTAVTVTHVYDDISLTLFVGEVPRLSETHLVMGNELISGTRNHHECLLVIICGSDTVLYFPETNKVTGSDAFVMPEAQKDIVRLLSQRYTILQIGGDSITAVTIGDKAFYLQPSAGTYSIVSLKISLTIETKFRNTQRAAQNQSLQLGTGILTDVTALNTGDKVTELGVFLDDGSAQQG